MIEVLEYKANSEKYPDTFGYMSLGSFTTVENNVSYFSFVTMKCLYLGKEFELILLNSIFTGELLVLGNLDNLPGNFIANREEFMEELKSIFESKQDLILSECRLLPNSFIGYHQPDQDTTLTTNNYYGKNISITC